MMDWADHINQCERDLAAMLREDELLFGADSTESEEETTETPHTMTVSSVREVLNADLVIRAYDPESGVRKIAWKTDPVTLSPIPDCLWNREITCMTVIDHHLVVEIEKNDSDWWWEEAMEA